MGGGKLVKDEKEKRGIDPFYGCGGEGRLRKFTEPILFSAIVPVGVSLKRSK